LKKRWKRYYFYPYSKNIWWKNC